MFAWIRCLFVGHEDFYEAKKLSDKRVVLRVRCFHCQRTSKGVTI